MFNGSHDADRLGNPAETVRRHVERALAGRASILLLLAQDVADASAALHTWVAPLLDRGDDGPRYTQVTGLAWEREQPGGVLERLGLDAEDPLLGLAEGRRVLAVSEAGDADPASLQALSSAVHRLGSTPVLVVLTASTAQAQAGDLGEIARAHRETTVRLDRLDGVGVQGLGARLGISLDDHTARRLADHTAGSTAATLELLEQHDPAEWRSPDTPLPATAGALRQIEDIWLVDPEVRPLTEACAAIGSWCTFEDAAAVAGLGENAGEVVDRAVELGALTTRRVSMRIMIGFRTKLLRAATYEAMGVARQRAIHRRATEVLRSSDIQLQQRMLASAGPDEVLAQDIEGWAAEQADQGAWHRAARAWLAASRISERREEASRRLVRCIDATVSDGNLYAARAVMSELELGEGRPERQAVLGYYQLLLGHKDEAEVLLKQAWEQARDADFGTRAFIAHRLTLHALIDWDSEALVHWGRLALDLAEHADPPIPAGFEAHAMLGLGLGGEGRTVEAEDMYQSLTSSENAGAQGQRALMGQGWLHLALERVPLAAHELEVAAPLTVWQGSTRISLWSYAWLAHARLALGDLSDAQAAVDQALPLVQETGQMVAMPLIHWAGAQIATLRGDNELAEQHAAKASAVRTDYQAMLVAATMARACVSIGTGDYAGTVRAFGPLVRLDRHSGIDEPGFWPWHDLYAIALVAIGEFDAADEFLRPHEERARERNHRSVMARLGAARGRLQFNRGDIDGGRETFEHSLSLISDLPMPLLRARIHLGYGQALRRLGKRRDAETELYHARRGYAAMGATGYVARCDRELKAGTRTRDSASVTELTAQEQAVVDHVVQGKTNREVAESLFISVKTVQYHLTRIYARLGIRSRSELTALWHST